MMDFETNIELTDETQNIEIPEYVQPRPIGVYVKRDSNGKIIEINSELFIKDFNGWQKIDEGFGDRFAHAQSQYKI